MNAVSPPLGRGPALLNRIFSQSVKDGLFGATAVAAAALEVLCVEMKNTYSPIAAKRSPKGGFGFGTGSLNSRSAFKAHGK